MNRIHQNVAEEDAGVSFRAVVGRRVGGARTNGLDPARLAAAAARAAGIARVQPEDPGFPGLVVWPAARDRGLGDFDAETASLGPERRAELVRPAVEAARREGLVASGALTVGAGELAVASTLGTFQHHAETDARLHVVVRREGAVEGACTVAAGRVGAIDAAACARRAVEKCLASEGAVQVEPGEWPVILEPDAAAELLDMLAYMGLGGLAFVEGRSFMSGRLGERLVSEKVTLADDPFHPMGEARPFDFEGAPKSRLVLIERGVAVTAVHDSRTAARAGVRSTGHALPEPNTHGPFPMNLVLAPGEATLDEMIASTERGILVSRFHYTNPVEPRRTVITGLTRFGTFLVEGGRVARAVRPMRFTDSVLDALSRVEMVGRDLVRADGTLAPALKLASWRFTGVSPD